MAPRLALLLALAVAAGGGVAGGLTDEEQEAVDAGEAAESWTAASIAVVSIACCCWACLPLSFSLCSCCAGDCPSCLDLAPLGSYIPPGQALVAEEPERIQRLVAILKAELLLSILQPYIMGLLWLGASLGLGSIPIALKLVKLLLLLPPAIRACIVDTSLVRLRARNEEDQHASIQAMVKEDVTTYLKKPMPFLFGKLEVTDATTDGISVVVVYLHETKNEVFEERLLAASGAGPVERLFAPLLLNLGLWGTMLLVQALAGLLQAGLGTFSAATATAPQGEAASVELAAGEEGPGGAGDAAPASWEAAFLPADIAGLGALAVRLEPEEGSEQKADKARQTLLKHLTKALYEGAAQFFLQHIAILAVGKGLLAQPTLVVSMAISSLLTMKKGAEMAKIGLMPASALGRSVTGEEKVSFFLFGAVPGFLIFAVVLAVALRLVMSETCESSLLFDVASWSCVAAPLPKR